MQPNHGEHRVCARADCGRSFVAMPSPKFGLPNNQAYCCLGCKDIAAKARMRVVSARRAAKKRSAVAQ